MNDIADQMRTNWGELFNGRADHSNHRHQKHLIGEILARALSSCTFAGLEDERAVLGDLPRHLMEEARGVIEDEEFAEYLCGRFYRALHRMTFDGEWNGHKKAGWLPDIAAQLMRCAIDLFAEDRTMIAYRNRHQEFIATLAELAIEASGRADEHRSFYAHLGRRVAGAVLEHQIDHPMPRLTPCSGDYHAIEVAAVEQLVYFIGVEPDGPIKIGIAAKPHERLANLQTAHHGELRLLAMAPGGRDQELAYHGHYTDKRLRGEWFERCPEILAEIDRLNSRRSDREGEG